jgi:hypothetical protein
MAQINLMELAYLDRRETTFEQYRRVIAAAELPPYIEAVYNEVCARGLGVFGRFEDSEIAFRDMLRVAERHGLNEFVVKAEQALEDVEAAAAATVTDVEETSPSQDLTAVAESLARMRVLAGL